MDQDLRRHIITEITRIAKKEFKTILPSACLYWADATMRVLLRHDIKACIQAGSACWPRMSPAVEDDGSPTHFSYMYEPTNPKTIKLQSEYQMPEIHVWVGIPDTQEIVDLTTKYWPEQCKNLLGYEFAKDVTPPEYLWCNIQDLPYGVIYDPSKEATKYAIRLLSKYVMGTVAHTNFSMKDIY